MKPRVIYEVEIYDEDYDVFVRAFVRNRRDANRIVSKYPHLISSVHPLNKRDFDFVYPHQMTIFGGDTD